MKIKPSINGVTSHSAGHHNPRNNNKPRFKAGNGTSKNRLSLSDPVLALAKAFPEAKVEIFGDVEGLHGQVTLGNAKVLIESRDAEARKLLLPNLVRELEKTDLNREPAVCFSAEGSNERTMVVTFANLCSKAPLSWELISYHCVGGPVRTGMPEADLFHWFYRTVIQRLGFLGVDPKAFPFWLNTQLTYTWP
jgi:hypothetical protein